MRPLLCRSPLLPDESLPSYLSRLAVANGYKPPAILTRICNRHLAVLGIRDNLGRPQHPETFDLLSSLTKISPGQLASATIHRFSQAPLLTVRHKQLIQLSDGHALQLLEARIRLKKLRKNDWAQFCPACLREQAYHRLSWIPKDVSVCLKHACLLVDHCDYCNAPVSIHDVVVHRCHRCGADFADIPPRDLKDKPFESFVQRMLKAWWGLAARPPIPSIWTMPAKPTPVLYRVWEGLVDSLAARWKMEHFYRQVSLVPSAHITQMTAFRGLVNWPQGFYDFLHQYAQNKTPGVHYSQLVYSRVEPLFSNWLRSRWQAAEFEFVQQAFDQFVIDKPSLLAETVWRERTGSRQGFAARFPFISRSQAAQLLETTRDTIENLAQKGIIETCSSDECWRLWVSRRDVVNLQIRQTEGFTLSETARWLGLSSDVVLDLMRAGLLSTVYGRTANGESVRLFHPPTVEELLARGIVNVSHLGAKVRDYEYLEFAAAILSLAVFDVDAALLIAQVLDGKLQLYLRVDKNYRFSTLCFLGDDLKQLADERANEKGWMGWREIACRMKAEVSVVFRWIRSGLLNPVASYASGPYFERRVVEEFIAGHVYTREAAKILGVNVRVVHRWAQNGKLKPMSGPTIDNSRRNLFRRDDVNRLRREQVRGRNA